MHKANASSVLASFATLKSLAEENKYKSPYQILREFIKYIITVDSLYSFSAVEMKNALNNHFGFSIPEAVVKTSLKNMDGVSLANSIYKVQVAEIGTASVFREKKREADDYEEHIVRSLCEYVLNKTGTSSVKKNEITQGLIAFLTDDSSRNSTKYGELIGEFILKNEQDSKLQEGLDKIREGSILYMGLSYNINETGNIKKPLSLYLGTEILFSLIGYNGTIFQQFANDFIEQVQIANSGESKKIALYYFSEIKKEIDEFFATASEIVERKRPHLLDKPAMKAITDGCKTASDVDVKKSDFYYKLEFGYGIKEDPYDNYYDEVCFSTNLENDEYDEVDKHKKKDIALKLISHINKLRNGNRYYYDIDSEHIIVTNTKVTLLISKEQTDIIKTSEGLENICNFAVSLDRIISLLWYKLGNGFSKSTYPSSVNALFKARVVLSTSIAKNAEKVFSEVKRQYESGLITEDQVAARIITLRNKPILPEDLQGDDIDEIMDFSPEYLSRYEEQFKNTQNSLKEKEEIIESLKIDTEKRLSEKDATIAAQNIELESKDDENAKLRAQVESYQRRDAESRLKKEKRKNKLKFAWSIFWKIGILIIFTVIMAFLEDKCNSKIPTYISICVNSVGVLGTIWLAVKKDWDKYMKNHSDISNAQI